MQKKTRIVKKMTSLPKGMLIIAPKELSGGALSAKP